MMTVEENLLINYASFAHGYYAIEETLLVFNCTEYFQPDDEYGFLWNDPIINIDWPFCDRDKLIISEKDRNFNNWNFINM